MKIKKTSDCIKYNTLDGVTYNVLVVPMVTTLFIRDTFIHIAISGTISSCFYNTDGKIICVRELNEHDIFVYKA